jgi:hypothetical protein
VFSEEAEDLFSQAASLFDWRLTAEHSGGALNQEPNHPNWIPQGEIRVIRAQSGTGGDDLATQVVDPTAALTSISFQNTFVPSYHGIPESGNTFTFRPVIPMQVFGQNQILRASIPYSIDGPGNDGLQPVQIFDLFVIEESWGRWGVGPLVSFTPASPNGHDTFQLGPAAGFTSQHGPWTLGFFNQNLLSDDFAVSSFQPIVAYTISKQWTVSLGDLQLAYDWKTSQWASLPIGFQVNYITKVFGSPLRFYYNPQYNFRQLHGTPEWSHTMGVSLLLP